MPKVRCYEVTLTDGYGPRVVIIPAHSKAAAEEALACTHVSADAKFIGFKECRVSYGPAGIIILVGEIEHDFESPAFNYLNNYCQSDISRIEESLKKEGYIE